MTHDPAAEEAGDDDAEAREYLAQLRQRSRASLTALLSEPDL